MASLPGMPGSLGIQGIQPLATGGGSTGGGSDLSLDIPIGGSYGFNVWGASSAGFPLGIDPVRKLVFGFAQNLATLYTFDFSAGPPASPSDATWTIDPVPGDPERHGTVSNRPFLLVPDSSDNFWIVNEHDGGPSDFDVQLQAYLISSGSQVSSIATPGTGSGQVPELLIDTFHGGGTCFSVGGLAHLAVWYSVYNPSIFTYDSIFLQIYDVSSGTASEVTSISFDLDSSGFTKVADGGVFYDGAGSLWIMMYTIDEHGQPTEGTLHKFSVPGYFEVASGSFSGAYGFIGDSCSGHVYVLNIDGSVSDVDPTTLIPTIHGGLTTGIESNPAGLAWYNGYPIVLNIGTYAMSNPVYGISTDPVTSQFFIQSEGGFGAYTRVQNFVAIDSLTLFVDWGLGPIAASRPIWVPSEQAMFAQGYNPGYNWYELKYAPLEPFCAGEETPTADDLDQFLPNVWITS